MKLLAIETATEACSAALWIEGQIAVRHEEMPRGHAERILPMIDALLAEAGLKLAALDALAFGRGPGGFTGVRLAASLVQGLAWGAGLGVVPVSTLRAVAQDALERDPTAEAVLVCNDARMQEVYWAAFSRGVSGLAEAWTPEQVGPPGSVALPAALAARRTVGAGRGFSVYPELGRGQLALQSLQPTLLPSAVAIARLAVPEVLGGRAVAAHEALPVYVRDNVAQPMTSR